MPKQERTLKVEAVVLRHSDWGEADRMLLLFTKEQGKLRAIAKGARRVRSRKAGHLEPFTRVSLMMARGRDLWIITQAETVDAYLAMSSDLQRTGYGAYLLELVDRFTYDEDANRGLYQLLIDGLGRVSIAEDEAEILLSVRNFEIRLLDLMGFRPQLITCVRCEKEIIAQDQYFSAQMGGVLCPDCGKIVTEARPISMEALKFLRFYQRSSFAEARRGHPGSTIQRELEAIMNYYLTYLLERQLNAPQFLREVKRNYSES